MNVLTAISLGNFELRICAQTQILSPLQQEQFDLQLIALMNQYGLLWKRYDYNYYFILITPLRLNFLGSWRDLFSPLTLRKT